MSRESLARLQEARAFDPAPRRSELHDLHVPFDVMTGGRGCEQSPGEALRRGHRVALVGISGAGKTSAPALLSSGRSGARFWGQEPA